MIIQPKPRWIKRHHPAVPPGMEYYTWGDVNVFVGVEEDRQWHLSISTPYRNPTWEEIKAARYCLLPHDITMAMILPPTKEYINIHQFCFHLYQIPNEVAYGKTE